MKKILLTLITCSLLHSLYVPCFSASKVNSLNLQEREIEGSIVNYDANKIIIPFAKKIGIDKEIKIQEAKNKDAETVTIIGSFEEDGSLTVDLNKLGVSTLLESKIYRIAARTERKQFVSKFTYHAPKIIRGIIEVPISNENSKNYSNSTLITVLNPITKEKIDNIKSIIAPGKIEMSTLNGKQYSKLVYPLFTEIPGAINKDKYIYEIKAELLVNINGRSENINLSSLIDTRDLNNKDRMLLEGIKANPATTISVKIIDSAIQKIKNHSSPNANIPEIYETYIKLSNIFEEANHSSSIEASINKIKSLIGSNSSALFKELFEYVSKSNSVTNIKDASQITLGISFKPTLISKDQSNTSDDALYFKEIVESIEKNSSEKDKQIIKNLI